MNADKRKSKHVQYFCRFLLSLGAMIVGCSKHQRSHLPLKERFTLEGIMSEPCFLIFAFLLTYDYFKTLHSFLKHIIIPIWIVAKFIFEKFMEDAVKKR